MRKLITQLLICGLQLAALLGSGVDVDGDGVVDWIADEDRQRGSPQTVSLGHGEHSQVTVEKLQALEHLISVFTRDESPSVAYHESDDPPVVAQVKKLVQARCMEPLTTRAAAEHVHLSADHVSRVFKRTTGMALREYLLRARVERAKRLLTDPSLRVCEVAYQSGFESIPYFNRVFRKLTGMSPTRYRHRLRS